jgi:hypothetical protein
VGGGNVGGNREILSVMYVLFAISSPAKQGGEIVRFAKPGKVCNPNCKEFWV